jgi:PAS domain S-box-containing protein
MTTNSTDRARADAALRDSERFRSVADAAPAMLWVTEPNGECSFLSRGWRDFTGQDEEKGLGAGWLEPLHVDDRGHVEAAFAAAAAKRVPFNLEHRLRRDDGAYRWVIDSGRPRFGDDGSFLGYVGIVIDITERQQKEVDHRGSREQLELLSDTLPALISYVGADRCYRTCNALYSKWFGLPREKIVGNTIEEVLGPAAWRVVGPHFERTLGGEPSELEAEVDYRHGGKRWIHARYTPHRGDGGTVVGVVCLVTDITARREAGHTRARLAAIVDSSDDAIVSKTLDGTITRWNAGAARLFGYTAEEAVGQPIMMLIPEDRRHEERGILERIRQGEPVKPYETIRRRKDGSLFNLSLSVSPIIDEAGNIVGASKIARDITARKRAEQDVRRSREALNGLIDRAPFGIFIVDSGSGSRT